MKNILASLVLVLSFGATASAAGNLRLPASVDCESSQITNDLSEMANLLNIQKVIKKSRFERMISDLSKIKSCEEANSILVVAIGDCVLTDRKAVKCK